MIGKRSQRLYLSVLWWLFLCLATPTQGSDAAPPLKTLHSFGGQPRTGNRNDGAVPCASVIQGRDGALYGTTCCAGKHGTGTVFKITTSGVLTTLYNFGSEDSSQKNADGAGPGASVIQGQDGVLYGTTVTGGTNGTGTVFKITTSGVLTTLYHFGAEDAHGKNVDGANPVASLIQGQEGVLYGMTGAGGIHNAGTVFKITTSGVFTSLHSFSAQSGNLNSVDGSIPWSGLMQGRDGAFYGTTSGGGTHGEGTVFKITNSGVFTIVHSFSALDPKGNNAAGAAPIGGLIQGQDGALYGTTIYGGSNGTGTVFQITTSGELTTLYSFGAQDSSHKNADGVFPSGTLIQGRNGALYGAISNGGPHDTGTVFKITTSGVLTTLYRFGAQDTHRKNTDGATPTGSVIQGQDGALYGTTAYGGKYGAGTVFKLVTTI